MEKKGTFTFKKFLVVIIPIFLVVIVANRPSPSSSSERTEESEKNEVLFTEADSGNKIETEYISIEDKFYLKVPRNFKQLDDKIITEKYNGDVPDIVFSNDEININIAVSLTENQMTDSQIKEYKELMETLCEYNGEIVDTDYYNVDNHNVGQIKVITDAIDTQIYNNMIFFSYDGKLVLVSFNCTEKLKDEWGDVGDFIISSLSFKE